MAVDVTTLSISVVSTGIKEASAAIGGLSTSAANAEKRILALTAATQQLSTINSASANAMAGYMAKLQQQAALMQTLQASSAGAAVSTQALAAAMALLAASLLTLNQNLQQADRSQRQHNEGMREAQGLARGLAGGLGALWLTYSAFLGTAIGVGIAGSLKAVVTMGSDVEHTLEGIRVRGQETVASIDAIRESLLNLGQGVYGPQQVAKAFETLILAGLTAQQSLASITAALNLATVGGTSIEKAATTLVSVGSAIGFVAEGYRRIGDVISKTAALSMSSVETLSEAFKSASSVNKLYGVSLEDIATSLGVLSNLGIQGSAAGTALKNMYKELASEAAKVTGTLDKMGLSQDKLKDANGNFLPLLTVIKNLDEALGRLSPQEEKLAIARLSNERGMRLMVQALDLYRTKLGDGSNALQKFQEDATNSYGFAAMGAVQMAQTAKSQMDSMMNTLKTVFVKTFKDVEPEIILFTQNMKRAFNSPEFAAGIMTIANAAASLALSVAENLPLITKFLAMMLAFKAIGFVSAMLESIAAGMMAIKVAMQAMAAGTLTLTLTMPALAAVLAVATAAWVAYNLAKGEAIAEKSTAVAAAYSQSVISGMIKEAEETRKATDLIRQGKTERQAAQQIENDNMLQKMKNLDQLAIANAKAETEKYRIASNTDKYAEGLKKVAALELQAINNTKLAAGAQAALAKAAKENSDVVEAKAKEKGARPDVSATLGGDISKSAAKDIYGAEIQDYQNQINAQKKILEQTKLATQSAYRQGLIGERGLIEENYTAEVTAAKAVIGLLQEKVALAEGTENKRRMAMKYAGEIQAQQAAIDATENARNRSNSEWLINNETRIQKAEAARFEAQGKYAAAYESEFGAKRDIRIKGIQADLLTEVNAVRRASAEKVLAAYEEEQAAGRTQAQEKEAMKSFMDLSNETRNALKGVQTASEGQGLAAMFTAAQAASETLANNMDELRNRMSFLVDPKDINEAQAQLTNLAESQRKLWSGVGEAIGKSLSSAFGKGGKATADLIKIGQNYANLENKTGDARIKAFGDAAGAAKGFFKEGTTGYKVMETAEKAFRIVQLIGMAQSLSATIANAAATAAAWIPAVFASFMGTMGPWGAAAAVAALAAVGIAAASGGGGPMSSAERQKVQGTGSVLGSPTTYGKNGQVELVGAKSESLVNSLAIMEKNSGLGLAQGNQMVTYLRAVADNITSLSSLIVRSTGITGNISQDSLGAAASTAKSIVGFLEPIIGGFTGKIVAKVANAIFGGNVTSLDTGFTAAKTTVGAASTGGFNASQYTNTKTDGGLFRSDKYGTTTSSLGADANNQFAGIVANMSGALKEASKVLGIEGAAFNAKLEGFVIDIGQVSLKGMTGAEIQEALQAVFSKLGDDMAKFAFTDFAAFQKVGEGFLETITRVANDVMQVKDVFSVLGKSFELTGTAAATVAEGLISAAGSIEKLTESTKYFVDNFLTEAERMAPITASVQNAMAQLGYTGVTTIDQFSKLVRSLDLTDPASQQLYTALLAIAPAFKEASDYATELAEGTVTLTKAQQKLLDAVTKAKSNLQDSYNAESSAIQSVIDKTKSFITTLSNYKDSLKTGADSPLTNIQKYQEAKKQFEAIAVAASAGDVTAQGQFTSASSALLAASKVVNASGQAYTDDYNMVQATIDNLMGKATVQVDVAQASLDALNRQVQGLMDINKSVMSVADAVSALQMAIVSGSAGGLSNNQMDTTYKPTASQIAAASPSANSNPFSFTTAAPVVAAIEANTAAVVAQTQAQSAGTGAVVGAVMRSSEDNAETVAGSIGGLGGAIRSAANKVALVAM